MDFLLYTSPPGVIAKHHQMNFHLYADDTQLYISFKTRCTNDMELSKTRMEACVRDIDLWMVQNQLKLNQENRHLVGACDYCEDVQGENMEVEYLSNILFCE